MHTWFHCMAIFIYIQLVSSQVGFKSQGSVLFISYFFYFPRKKDLSDAVALEN